MFNFALKCFDHERDDAQAITTFQRLHGMDRAAEVWNAARRTSCIRQDSLGRPSSTRCKGRGLRARQWRWPFGRVNSWRHSGHTSCHVPNKLNISDNFIKKSHWLRSLTDGRVERTKFHHWTQGQAVSNLLTVTRQRNNYYKSLYITTNWFFITTYYYEVIILPLPHITCWLLHY